MERNSKRWAQKRNYAKRRVLGMIATCTQLNEDGILTLQEQLILEHACSVLTPVLDTWEANNAKSKKLWLSGR